MELGVRFEKVADEIRSINPSPKSAREIERIVLRHYIEKLERLEIS
jgi:hypothetical protein